MVEGTPPEDISVHGWRKSSYSGPEGGSCLEVLDNHPSGIPVRDSKVPGGRPVVFQRPSWSFFIEAVKSGGFSSAKE